MLTSQEKINIISKIIDEDDLKDARHEYNKKMLAMVLKIGIQNITYKDKCYKWLQRQQKNIENIMNDSSQLKSNMITLQELVKNNPYNFSYKTLYKAIRRGKLAATKISGSWWTSMEAYNAWMRPEMQLANPEQLTKAEELVITAPVLNDIQKKLKKAIDFNAVMNPTTKFPALSFHQNNWSTLIRVNGKRKRFVISKGTLEQRCSKNPQPTIEQIASHHAFLKQMHDENIVARTIVSIGTYDTIIC